MAFSWTKFIFLTFFYSVVNAQAVITLPPVASKVVDLSKAESVYSIDRLKTPRHPSDEKKYTESASRFESILTVQQEYQPELISSFVAHELGGTPNDNSIAISDDKTILAIQNKYIYAFKPDGSLIFLKTLRSFLGTQQTAIFDPHVVFDPASKRFIIVMVAGRTYQESQVYLAFSQSADPSAGWNVYSLSGNPANDQTWSDFPSISITPSEVLLTTNQFFNGSVNNSGFHQSLIWRISKNEGLTGAPLQARVIQSIKTGDQKLFNLTPASEIFVSSASVLFLSNHALTGGSDIYAVQLDGDTPKIKKVTGNVSYAVPRDAGQKNTTVKLNTNDCRILDAVQLQDRTYFAFNTNANNTPSIYFGALTFQNNELVLNAALITDTLDIAFPSLATLETTSGMSIMMGYLHSSTKVFPGASVVDVRVSGTQIITSRPVRIKNGNDYFGVWGDYTDITAIPGEQAVLFCGSFGLSSGSIGGGESATIIGKVQPSLITEAPETLVQEIELYPNPVQVYFHLELPTGLTGEISIDVYDLHKQKLVSTSEKIQREGNYRFTYDCRNLPTGVYLATVYHNGQKIGVRKFTVIP